MTPSAAFRLTKSSSPAIYWLIGWIVLSGLSPAYAQIPVGETLDAIDGAIHSLAWSPDGKWIAVAKSESGCISRDPVTLEPQVDEATSLAMHAIYLISAETSEVEEILLGNHCSTNDLEWSADGTKLASASMDSRGVRVWDVETGQLIAVDQRRGQGTVSVSWRPDNSDELLVTDIANGVFLVSARTGEQISLLPVGGGSADWNADGSRLVAGSFSQSGITVFDYVTSTPIYCFEEVYLTRVTWSPLGNYFAASTSRGVRVWNADTGTIHFATEFEHEPFFAVEFSPDERYLALSSQWGSLIIFDIQTGEELHRLSYPGEIFALAWSPDKSMLAYGGDQVGSGKNVVLLLEMPSRNQP